MKLEESYDNILMLTLSLPLVSLFVGFWFAYVQLFMHEAAHHNIHANKDTNDLLANIFLCIWVGANIKSYRENHWKHHQRLGYVNDTEHSYFNGLTLPFFIKMLTGLHALDVLKGRNKKSDDKKDNDKEEKKQQSDNKYIFLIGGMALHALFLGVLLYHGLYFTILVWLGAVGVFFPFFATMRQLLEHRDADANNNVDYSEIDHGVVNRLFKNSLFACFFGAAGFSRHMLHHWEPSVSYTRLNELERFCRNTEELEDVIINAETTYTQTFFKLLK